VAKKRKPRASDLFLKRVEQDPAYLKLCKAHPVQAALWRAAFMRMCRIVDWYESPPEDFNTLQPLISELKELLGWIGKATLSDEEILLSGVQWLEAGLSPSQVVALQKAIKKRPRGRPVEQRALAVKALEMRRADPKLSWARLTKEICPCGQPAHDLYCRERIRQQVLALNKALKKYQI